MPQPTPDGRMAPALLTDDGITETVAEFPKNGRDVENLSKSLRLFLQKALNLAYRKVLRLWGQKFQHKSSMKNQTGSVQDAKKLVTPQKAIDKIPTQGAKEQQETESPEAPKK